MQLSFRDAIPEDAERLTALARLAKASWDYPEAWLNEWRDDLRFTPTYIVDNKVLVAISEEKIVGVVALEWADQPVLEHLWIAPKFQRQGLGKRLVERALVIAKECGWDSLVVQSDPNASQFYQSVGAVLIGEVDAPVCGVARSLPVFRLYVP